MLEEEAERLISKRKLSHDKKDAYIYGTMNAIEKRKKRKRKGKPIK